MDENKKKIDELEHKVLRGEMRELKNKVTEGFGSIHSTITQGFELMDAKNKGQNEASTIQRNQIIQKQDLTNGRVTVLEEVTSTIKYLNDHKKIAGLLFYSLYNMLQHLSVSNLYKIYQWMQSMM